MKMVRNIMTTINELFKEQTGLSLDCLLNFLTNNHLQALISNYATDNVYKLMSGIKNTVGIKYV